MGPLLQQTGGIWIGWPGESSGEADEQRQKLLERWAYQEGYFAVDLPKDVAVGFYEGFSNQTLWPLFHQFPSELRFDPDHWRAYVEANHRFRDKIVEHLRPDDIVWIHDYQLMLLPRLLREAVPKARIGFFLHIPFPNSAVFRLLPRREELLSGLLGADYIAFHTYGYLQHFRTSVLRILGLESRMNEVDIGGRTVRLDALPIGVAPREFTDLLESDKQTKKRLAEIRERYKGRHLLIGVDRLDYTKGIPERLRTFRRLLRDSPELRGKVVMVQVGVPSREVIPKYKALRKSVDELVGKINGEFSTPEWTPIVYIRRGVPKSELAALYAASDVALVTPLRDGLNLVAKEYVACQRNGAGALVLSEFAGAAAEMGEAFLVNPYDEERTAATIRRALETPLEERRERMSGLYRRVVRNNVFAWGERFIENLLEAAKARRDRSASQPMDLPTEEVVNHYNESSTRLLLLDYDGTLADFARRPEDAKPSAQLMSTLAELASDQANQVAVISGRSRGDLEAWFGNIQGLWLAAEHGAIIRSPETREWETYKAGYSGDWKERVKPVLDHFVDRTPGSLIEEKEYSLVWHYRMSDPEFGEWLANELVAALEQMLAETDLRAFRGNKIVEVKPLWANKGEVLARLSESTPDADFWLAAGDDRTDEDLFERLPEDAWSIHIGPGHSRARYFLDNPEEMRRLLASFVDGSVRVTATGSAAD
jgi:trehalose 6-phosphate synthase/phosphatase